MSRKHLTARELVGYIYQTLTDAERETLDQHLASCGQCRVRLEAESQIKRQVGLGLEAAARQAKPSAVMNFEQIRPQLSQARRWAKIRHTGWQLVLNLTAVAVVVLGSAYLFLALQPTPQGSPPPASVLNLGWTDGELFQAGIITAEQANALELLSTAPIYHLDLTLDESLSQIDGRQTIRFVNRSAAPLNEIYLWLLPNIAGSKLRLLNSYVNSQEVTPIFDSNITARLPLAEPLLPGRTAYIHTDFSLHVNASRQGLNGAISAIDGILTLANFYPLVAAQTADGWMLAEPVHGISSVADDSFYVVRVSAPSVVTLIASGQELKRDLRHSADGVIQQSVIFAAGPINEFFLSASGRYSVKLSATLGETTINSYAYADYLLDDANKMLNNATDALKVYTDKFGPYPFRELDIIGTKSLLPQVEVQAYPTVALVKMDRADIGKPRQEESTVYGVGYQWFGRINRQNMLLEPWLGYGLTAYSVSYYYEAAADPTALRELQARWADERWEVRDKSTSDAIGLPAASFSAVEFTTMINQRAPATLNAISRLRLGDKILEAALRDYYTRHRWIPGSSAAFEASVAAACQCDLTQLFREKLRQ